MDPTAKQLLETRAALAAKIKEMAGRHDKGWTPEDQANWEKLNKDYDACKASLDGIHLAEQVASRVKLIDGDLAAPSGATDVGRGDANHADPAPAGDRRPSAGLRVGPR